LKDKIIVNSKEDKNLAIKYGICPPEKISNIYNGIDTENLDFLSREEARDKLSQPHNFKIVGSIANFYKTKGLEYLIKSAHIIKNEYKREDIRYVVIGDGKERKKLESLIKKYDLGNTVYLAGRMPDAYKYLKAFDVFVLPSVKEGFPWIILEAMASGVPIVATKVGAVPEIIDDRKEGLLVNPRNEKELAKNIMKAIIDSDLSIKMINNAKEKLKYFSSKKMLEQTKALF